MGFQQLTFDLPTIDESHVRRLYKSKRVLESRATSAGHRSSKLEEAICRLKDVLRKHGDISSFIESPIDAKAFASYFAHNEERTGLPITRSILDSIDASSTKIKRQTLMLLVEGYLFHYDENLDLNSLNMFGDYIKQRLSHFDGEGRGSELKALARNREIIFSRSGPNKIVTIAREQSVELEDAFSKLGLDTYCDGQYFLMCRYMYYLKELKAIPIGSDHKILMEVTEKAVCGSRGDSMPQLGHEVVAILIDRSKGHELSDPWMRVILEIAGDPRIQEDSEGYRRWWSHLGAERISLMRGWLSRVDLKLFLQFLDDYGKSSGDIELQRMYPSRKQFLEGLIDQNLVSNSRLFVNWRAEAFLKKAYKSEDLPEYAKVKDSYRSMIYLQVGNLHMIEGSHSFKLWIFPEIPESSNILSYQHADFTARELSSGLKALYDMEFGFDAKQPANIVHQPQNFSWQHHAIQYLKERGVKLKIEKLFSNQDYKKYLKIYGL